METNPYRLLPSVEEVLLRPGVDVLAARVGREVLTSFVRSMLEDWRAGIAAGSLDAPGLEARLEQTALAAALGSLCDEEEGRGLRRAINATGVVLHTGLGRSPVHPEVAERMAIAASSFCVLEVDRFSGERNRRDERLSELLVRLTGAEAAIAVNNNAAAVLLVIQTFAAGKQTVVSRGELVEIGGSFRMPDVMTRAGSDMVEVGTTNRTRVGDYEEAVGERTGLLLKVHTSNFRQVGFTEEVSAFELAELGRKTGVVSSFDLGSGLLEPEGAEPLPGLGDEPLLEAAVQSGVDVVTFSGDKLFGGPQAGLLLGKRAAIDALRKNPLYRALRLDKVGLAGLERTAELYLEGRGDEIPARALLRRDDATLRERAETMVRELASLPGSAGIEVEAVDGQSQPGSGSAPGVLLPTVVVRVVVRAEGTTSVGDLAQRMRAVDPPVFVRIQDGALLIDPRTLLPGEDAEVVAALCAAARG